MLKQIAPLTPVRPLAWMALAGLGLKRNLNKAWALLYVVSIAFTHSFIQNNYLECSYEILIFPSNGHFWRDCGMYLVFWFLKEIWNLNSLWTVQMSM